MKKRIAVNPEIHFAKPCVAGTRIPVQNVLCSRCKPSRPSNVPNAGKAPGFPVVSRWIELETA